jgi:predicted DCC family thiol-disulfide oxidoreductase YuxK
MTALYLLYDSRCALCVRLQAWVAEEPAWWPVTPIAAGSGEAERRFPGLDGGELTVIAHDGRYWRGDHAWLIVLFAMKRYRDWARRLTHPLLLPFARQAFAAVSERRESLNWWLGLSTREETARQLSNVSVPGCDR